MPDLLLKNVNAVLPGGISENVSILLEEGKISEITTGETKADQILDLAGLELYAGFIDIHIHGAVGVDVNDARAEELQKMARFLARQGTTAWLPTFVPDADENYRKTIVEIEKLKKIEEYETVAQVLGVHYEGVFANEKMCGALRPQYFKIFTGNEIEQLPKLAGGVHFTTLAPEVAGGIDLIKKLIEQNWIVSVGHTKADLETLEKAEKAGARHLTHFFNAMTGLHHRETGVVGWGLINENATFDIIADGVHVAPEMLKFAVRSKSTEKVSLISDAVLPTGLGDGDYEIWDEKVSVAGGKTRNERGSIAGSVITMLDAVRRMLSLGFSEREVSNMASANPARLLGIENAYGSIETGKRADLVALDGQGNVQLVLIGGNVAFSDV